MKIEKINVTKNLLSPLYNALFLNENAASKNSPKEPAVIPLVVVDWGRDVCDVAIIF